MFDPEAAAHIQTTKNINSGRPSLIDITLHIIKMAKEQLTQFSPIKLFNSFTKCEIHDPSKQKYIILN